MLVVLHSVEPQVLLSSVALGIRTATVACQQGAGRNAVACSGQGASVGAFSVVLCHDMSDR